MRLIYRFFLTFGIIKKKKNYQKASTTFQNSMVSLRGTVCFHISTINSVLQKH